MNPIIIQSPSKYVQGRGLLGQLGQYYTLLGSQGAYILADPFVADNFKDTITAGFPNIPFTFEAFGGECSEIEVHRNIDLLKKSHCDVVIGIGGGKTMDTAKAIAYYEKIPVIIVPTIASADAPCTALSVLYTPDGQFDKYLFLPTNPNMVIMDTEVIANAPVRTLVAGMGDALATYFEAQTCFDADGINLVHGKPSRSGLALAQMCFDTLMEDGVKAKQAVEARVLTKAVENIIEANTFLSGVGAESGGLATAHSVCNGLSALKECHHMLHGEKVAFGLIVQLVVENKPMELIETIINFCMSVGLPTTLADLGAKDVSRERIMEVAVLSTAEGETVHNSIEPITSADVFAAIIAADTLGHSMK